MISSFFLGGGKATELGYGGYYTLNFILLRLFLTMKSLWAGHVFPVEIMILTYRSLLRIFSKNILSENHYGCDRVESIL